MYSDSIYAAGIQKAINEKCNLRLAVDGDFGPKSIAGLKSLQSKNGLSPTGVYDAPTWQFLDAFIRRKYLTMDAINAAAKTLKVTPAHVRAVLEIESKGSGFLPDGRPKILFERHKFLESLKKSFPPESIKKLMGANPDIINTATGGYVGDEGEHTRFKRAAAIDEYSALYATSFGLFQIMGFNHGDAGYGDIFAYAGAMAVSETNHLNAFVSFLKKNKKGAAWAALQADDWVGFARVYNGESYAKYEYDKKLKASFAKYSKDINVA